MTVRMSGDTSDGRAGGLGRLTEDDLLFDQLGRGEQPAERDDLVAALAEWRAALPDAGPTDDELDAAAVSAVRRSRRTARWARRSLVLATAGLLTFCGLTAAAHSAGPASPLWPVTTLLYPDLAESRAAADAAGRAVADARAAIEDGRYEPASRLLDHAWSLVDQVDEPASSDRLLATIAALRAEIVARRDTQPPSGPGDPGSGARNSLPNVPQPAPSPPPTSAPRLSQLPETGGPTAPTSAGADTEVPGDLPSLTPVPAPSLIPERATPTALVPNLDTAPGR